MVMVYVDDVVFFGKDLSKKDKTIEGFKSNGYPLTKEEDLFHFLGVDITQNEKTGKVTLKQLGLINKILKHVDMEDCNTKETPAMKTPLCTDAGGEPFNEKWEYARVVGMLLYVSSHSRPDIQYAVHSCARFTHCPRKSHGDAIKRICRYLQGTKNKGLQFRPSDEMRLDCYVDSDFAGLWSYEENSDPVCVKSRTGFVILLGGCPLVWISKLQQEITLSTTEAEYVALSMAMRELIPQRELLKEIGRKMDL